MNAGNVTGTGWLDDIPADFVAAETEPEIEPHAFAAPVTAIVDAIA